MKNQPGSYSKLTKTLEPVMCLKTTYPFILPPLPYPYDGLEPFIDMETVYYHHDKHFQTYIDNLNKALENQPKFQSWPLEKLLTNIQELPATIRTAVKNNAGGVYNHWLYFDQMTPYFHPVTGPLEQAIADTFGTMEAFQKTMTDAGMSQFGSGYAWLVKDDSGRLTVLHLPNQDTPLPTGLIPILLVDVWEHAYYLKYQYRRANYISAWFSLIDWKKAGERYLQVYLP